MKNILFAVLLLFIYNCKAQKDNLIRQEMKMFDIKKIEENKGKGIVYNSPNIYDYETKEGYQVLQSKYKQDNYYSEKITKKISPYIYFITYSLSGYIESESLEFNNSPLILKEYDNTGHLVKETNFDKNFKHNFEQIREFVLKEKDVDIYDTRQAIALRHDTPFAPIKKYYQIHVLKSNFIDGKWYAQPNYSFLIDYETGKIVPPKNEE